jgi:hypothetical protein
MSVTPRTASLVAMCLVALGAMTFGEQTSVPQPRADQLPAVGPARANRGGNVPIPAGALPTAPAGFTVSPYAELQGPRMMVYAPNGDLFVSSPTTNAISVLRDTNGDGTFEARGVFAQGEVPAARGGAGGARAGGARPGGPPAIAPASAPVNPEINGPILGANAPACTPPPPFHNPGPGTLAAPFHVARAVPVYRRRSDGAGRAREVVGLSARRPHHPQYRLQPRRDEDVRGRGVVLEQQRRRGLQTRGHPRVQP